MTIIPGVSPQRVVPKTEHRVINTHADVLFLSRAFHALLVKFCRQSRLPGPYTVVLPQQRYKPVGQMSILGKAEVDVLQISL